ncbi:MAG: hypothetical protein LBR18_08540 [Tannerella sp.]|jgi:tetratricopeptide (TPR) repeat protein|nr:hypothetical protein [Tannerella sp.]
MKRTGFMIGLSLMVSVTMFGQKKAVTEALKLAKDAKPNFTEARALIKGALDNAETKGDAKTWYTAGLIESLQFDAENMKALLSQPTNDPVMYGALGDVWQYFQKAYELDKLPDAKGKVKPKYVKDMKNILTANLPYYINGGAYYFDKQDFKKAYDLFDQYIKIKDSDLLKEGVKPGTQAPIDSIYLYSVYYAGIASSTLNDHATAVEAMTRATKQDFHQNEMLQYLSEEYRTAGDTLNWEKTLEEGMSIFPKDQFFILNLINVYVYTNRYDKAESFIKTALKDDPNNAQLYDLAGRINESYLKDYAAAEENFKKAVELDSENAETQSSMGRIYFNQGVILLEAANEISDVKKYNEEKDKAKELFRKALPYFEKAYKLNPEANDNKLALRSIYYHLDMGDKYEEMDKMLNEGSN